MFSNSGDWGNSQAEGREVYASFRKVPSQASSAGWWVDLSMAAGNPPPNFYAAEPLVAAQLTGLRGIYNGGAVSPGQKYLASLGLCTPSAALVGQYRALDYALYYPFIDMDSADEQVLDNTLQLSRYTTKGCQVMAVVSAPTLGGGSFVFTYVNQDGVVQTSPTQFCGTAVSNISNLLPQRATVGGLGPFLQLAAGDTGVRQINSVTFLAPNGGLVALVLVRPLADLQVTEINAPVEKQWIREGKNLAPVPDGAYLGLIVNCAASVAAAQLMGWATFVWKD